VPRDSLANTTIGVLTHEAAAFAASLQTYEERGLLALVGEVVVFMNKRSRDMDEALAPFLRRWPGLFVVLDAGLTPEGAPDNWSIAAAINTMVSAAGRRFFLLLERDFQLVEPDTCALEQLRAAEELLDAGEANVVRMRSRRFDGLPNRGAELFQGKEWIAFDVRHWGGFAKYVCTMYHWIEEPHKRYPDVFRECASASGVPFYCTTSMHCDWTNNPVMFEKGWWQREYLGPTVQNPGEAWDLEGFVSRGACATVLPPFPLSPTPTPHCAPLPWPLWPHPTPPHPTPRHSSISSAGGSGGGPLRCRSRASSRT
jgi:hypothetical protein